jgi:hypothetical protein
MAVTGLRVTNEKGTQNMLVSTVPFEVEIEGQGTKAGVTVLWQIVDDDMKPIGSLEETAHERTEEDFHRTLRQKAAEENHLITGWSSDPEWNPEGYIKIFKKDGSM